MNDSNQYLTLTAGGSVVPAPSFADVFIETDSPVLQTVGYYFASQTPNFYLYQEPEAYGPSYPSPPLPGSPFFAATNISPPLITGFGQLITVSGWAKMAIANGYSGKYAYLEQYWDKAYKIDTNGIATTNQTGLLSPYGEFFPSEPGPAALVTMPDIDTSQRGTGIVNVIKLQLDVNHDGVMDLTFGGPDNTSQDRPFVFWVNNDFDRLKHDIDDNEEYEDSTKTGSTYEPGPDCEYRDLHDVRKIPTRRDLEDFARLWICGVSSNVLAALPYAAPVTLSWKASGLQAPTIDLFAAGDFAQGGIGYLTNSDAGLTQIASQYIDRLAPGQTINLNWGAFANTLVADHMIFCGVSRGKGELVLTIWKGTNILAQTSAWIEIKDIKEMYERWTVGDSPKMDPTNTAYLASEDLPTGLAKFQYPSTIDTNTPYILFVHGWNMEQWEKDRFAERAFKRLYWQGYQGRFGLFRWPTDNGFSGEVFESSSNPLTDSRNYDRSEWIAWRSAAGLLNKLNDLNAKYPGHVYMLAHSMGNVVAGEALRLSGSNRVVNTYIASQSAIPAHVYDSTVTNALQFTYTYPTPPLSLLGSRNYGPDTPNIYGDWLAANSGAVGRRINFYNPNDYALAAPRWGFDQITKPDSRPLDFLYWFDGTPYDSVAGYTPGSTDDNPPWDHFFKGTSSGGAPLDITILTNRYEIMACAAESRSTALGATARITNFVPVDLTRLSNPLWVSDPSGHGYGDHFWHSAQFRGDAWQEWNYWKILLRSADEGFDIQN
jgi:hypothetical protein